MRQPVKIKLCGLTRPLDIEAANELMPEYIGFVFAPSSKRYVAPREAGKLRSLLHPAIAPVGVFVNTPPGQVAKLLNCGIIDIAQLHGAEDEDYISYLRTLTAKPLIKAFRITTEQDLRSARTSSADYVLLDSGPGGTGTPFNWTLLDASGAKRPDAPDTSATAFKPPQAAPFPRPYFLAGGLSCTNIAEAMRTLTPYAVDVSSGIETNGCKDPEKMRAFVHTIRNTPRPHRGVPRANI